MHTHAAETLELIKGLRTLAQNIWWTWNQDARDIFAELSPRTWHAQHHNPVAVLNEMSDTELRVRMFEPDFARRVRAVLAEFDAYVHAPTTWITRHLPELANSQIAYFSAEFGLHEILPIAAGGLGVLAGDHAKAASDVGLKFVGISLFYREGYFHQTINHDNWQTESYTPLKASALPIDLVLDSLGKPVICSVELPIGTVNFCAWRINVGRCPIYLLDADLVNIPDAPVNPAQARALTLRVYGGDTTTRILQEILLGIGGVRLLRKLGIEPDVFHMNEGHAAFLTLELAREKMAEGMRFADALAATRSECIFTTHTPVPAGHDRFSSELMSYALGRMERDLKLSHTEMMALGQEDRTQVDSPFCMTVLALNASRAANGVSELHGQVSREMWQKLYPGKTVDQVPIGHVTNGVHLLGWMKGPAREFWVGHLGKVASEPSNGDQFYERINHPDFWKRIEDEHFVSDEELWALRYRLRRELVEFARVRMVHAATGSPSDVAHYDKVLNVDALTIGFARRFATYKRAPLIFDRFDDLVKLVNSTERPVQLIFAGKAHPADNEGKKFIQKIIHLSEHSYLKGSLVFVEDYDIHVARHLVAGCDVWLNNPRRPLEASGTSGMKTLCHGCLNFSIMDGWWREGYDGQNGYSIGDDTHSADVNEQDRSDSDHLFRTLSEEIIPAFYNRDAHGIPRQWLRRVRRSIATMTAQFTTWRMVQEYARKYYLPPK